MPSYLHELLVLLLRNRSTSAAELLRQFDMQVPEYDKVRVDSADLNDVQPAEYRADLVSFLVRGPDKVLGVVVEVQLSRDEDKRYSWPAHVANLRARHRCPVCLLVVTVEESVARWARKAIELGPGTRCCPWVVGPSNTPVITELQDAKANVELAVLSAIEHGQSADVALAARIASAALRASADIDAARSRLYIDLILRSLPKSVTKEHEVPMGGSLGFEYQSDFACRFYSQGKAEGKVEGKAEGKIEGIAEGRVEIVLKLLALRFGPLSEAVQACVHRAEEAQLDAMVARVLTAQTLEEALGSLVKADAVFQGHPNVARPG
jgi:hypothetical protein